jgi:signal transduction histidine kinase/ActR/RegA family two-component response regulator
MNDQYLKRNWFPLLLGAAVLVLAHCAALLFRIQPAVSLWFPPSGVAIVLAIWFGKPAVVITALVSILMAPLWGNHGWTRLAGLSDAVEPLIAWWFYRQAGLGSLTLYRLKDVSTFILSAPVSACFACAIAGSLTLAVIGNLPWENISISIPHWWLGNAIGTMTIAPWALLVLTPILQERGWVSGSAIRASTPNLPHQNSSRAKAEKIAILSLCVAIALLSVSRTSHAGFAFQQFSFLNFVPILWAALRFGSIGGTTTASCCVVAALLCYILKYPEALRLDNFPIDPDVLTVHKMSLLVESVIGLLMGTAITQQTQAQIKLAISQVQLAEYEVRSRLNEQLEQTNQALAQTNAQLEQANCEKDELLKREQAARSQAEAANRIKDEFLAVVSHELRTPLSPILGWSNLLLSRKLDTATTQKALETISRNAKHQSQLIEDLLDVSRILRGKLVLQKIELDLALVIRSAIETVRLFAEAKAISLTFTQSDLKSTALVQGDPNRLQQVMGNLLTNAIKFTPPGGQVTVTMGHYSGDVHPDATQLYGSDYVQISVSDTGKGIQPDFLPHVFERFRQEEGSTTRRFGGLGLGLVIVCHLVELHQGTVEAKSEGVNRGATFIVRLPLIDSGAETSLPELSTLLLTPVTFLKGLQILVVDDDPDARDLLQHIFQMEQAIVQLANSAQDAISQVESSLPDLIISDISMPNMDGYDFIRHIRNVHSQKVVAIALTANAKAEDHLRAIAAGFDGHLAKPITPEALFAEIERLFRFVESNKSTV